MIRMLAALFCAVIGFSSPAAAVTYTYEGSPYDTLGNSFNGYNPFAGTTASGWFTVAEPLAANLSSLTLFTQTTTVSGTMITEHPNFGSFYFSSGTISFSPNYWIPSASIVVSTNEFGQISTFNIVMTQSPGRDGPVGSGSLNIGTTSATSTYYRSQAGGGYYTASGSGIWSVAAVPVPANIALFGSVLIAFGAYATLVRRVKSTGFGLYAVSTIASQAGGVSSA